MSRRDVRDSIRAKLADLPRVDHNGTPIRIRPLAVEAVREVAQVPEEAERTRPLLKAPQGPRGDGWNVARPAEPSLTEKNRAVALAAAIQIPYAEALDIERHR
jgi:hypothetical protein